MSVEHVDPPPTHELTETQLYYFEVIGGLLAEAGKLMPRFASPMADLAVIWDQYRQATKELNEHGRVQVADSGWPQKSAYLSAWLDLLKEKRKIEADFGITVTGFESMGTPPPKKNPDFD